MLRHCLIDTSVRVIPMDGGGFVLDTDANNYSMGRVLQQLHGGELKVIWYASMSFKDAEVRYCTTHRVLAAFIYGHKYYCHFFFGFPFLLRTDHAALTHLLWMPHLVVQSARYLDTLVVYQFSIQCQPGLAYRKSDVLSLRPCNRDFDVLLCGQCRPMLDTIEEETEEESDDQLEEGRVVTMSRQQTNLGRSLGGRGNGG